MKNILYEERESDKHVASILKVGRGWGGGIKAHLKNLDKQKNFPNHGNPKPGEKGLIHLTLRIKKMGE